VDNIDNIYSYTHLEQEILGKGQNNVPPPYKAIDEELRDKELYEGLIAKDMIHINSKGILFRRVNQKEIQYLRICCTLRIGLTAT
jgi:hypothetical protein